MFGDCLPLTQLVFFIAQKPTCSRPLPCLTQDGKFHLEPRWLRARVRGISARQPSQPLFASPSGPVLLTTPCPCHASAIPSPASCQLPPPPQPLGCPLLWRQRRMKIRLLPLPCVPRISCPHLFFGKLAVNSLSGEGRPTVLEVGQKRPLF